MRCGILMLVWSFFLPTTTFEVFELENVIHSFLHLFLVLRALCVIKIGIGRTLKSRAAGSHPSNQPKQAYKVLTGLRFCQFKRKIYIYFSIIFISFLRFICYSKANTKVIFLFLSLLVELIWVSVIRSPSSFQDVFNVLLTVLFSSLRKERKYFD